uniref:Uncharacterized protein n=1 Tax=Polytomella parva TaxID=51329 RepID=A0A7S0VD87_9CHLO
MSEQPTEQVQRPVPRRIEYFAEENFKDANLFRSVHLGWGFVGGSAAVLACMGISASTQSKSANVSFRWLQRRVGFQFATLSYTITSNLMYYYDGKKWVTRDWADIMRRFTDRKKGRRSDYII